MAELPRIEPAVPDDAAEIMAVGQVGVEAPVLHITITGSPGYGHYVRDQIAYRRLGADAFYLVARAGRRLAGFAELRRHPRGLFLNNLTVRPEFRCLGVGRRLLEAALRHPGAGHSGAVLLDVFEHNVRARAWYERLGFRQESVAEWWALPPARGADAGPALLIDYPHAEVTHRQFGFSRFTVATARGRYEVGRLHRDWFRLMGAEPLADPALLGLLARLDPDRRLLVRVPAGKLPAARSRQAVYLARHCRMITGLSELLHRLG